MDIPPQLDTFFMVLAFVLGAMAGSFCNVCICRWPEGESVVSPRSRCPHCGYRLAWYDNMPLVSWLVLGARCRQCKAPISWQYPVVEALTGVLFLLVYLRFGVTPATPVYWALCAGLVIVTFADLREWIIPNEVTFTGIPAGVLVALLGMLWPEASGLRVVNVFDALGGVLLGGGVLYVLDQGTQLILKKPGMGMGDVKLLAMIGAFLGWHGVLGTLMIACVIGSVAGLALIAVQRLQPQPVPLEVDADEGEGEGGENAEEVPAGHYIPFGPYLALAGVIFLFIGPEAIAAYLAAFQPGPLM